MKADWKQLDAENRQQFVSAFFAAVVAMVLETIVVLAGRFSSWVRVPHDTLRILLVTLCCLPVIVVILWLYERHVLAGWACRPVIKHLTSTVIAIIMVTGIFLGMAMGIGGTVTRQIYRLKSPTARLVVLQYASNGRANPLSEDSMLFIEFRSYVSDSEGVSGHSDVSRYAEFEGGVLLSAEEGSIDLDGYGSLVLSLDILQRQADCKANIGVGLKDETDAEVKCFIPDNQMTLGPHTIEVPLGLFSDLELERIAGIVIFVRDLKRGESLQVRITSLEFT